MSGGSTGQIGWKSESTPGTAVVVDTFQPFLSENVQQSVNMLQSATLSARRTARKMKQGSTSVGGPVSMELPNEDIAVLMKHMFGSVATTGAGPYTHTYTPGDLTGDSLTVQVGRPATAGTVHPFTYAGCKVADWTISCDTDAIAKLDVGLMGMTETTATGLATAAYSSTWDPFMFTEGSLSIGGSNVATVKSASLTGNNAVQSRVRWGSRFSLQPLEIGARTYEGTVTTDFDDLTHYNLFVNGTETAMVLAFDNGTDSLTITMNVMFTGATPAVSGPDLLEQSLPFTCISSTSDAAAITAVLVNSESTAA